MTYAPKVILQLPLSDAADLAGFVEKCLTDQVSLISISGPGCAEIEDEIDWLIVGDGSDEARHVTTAAHPNECLADVIEFAENWRVEGRSGVELVKL